MNDTEPGAELTSEVQGLLPDVEDLWWMFYLHKEVHPVVGLKAVEVFSKRGIQKVYEYVSEPFFRILLRDTQTDIYFEISNSSDRLTPFLFLGVNSDLFVPPEAPSARLNADLFLEYGKVCYRTFHPKYGFAARLDTYVETADVDACRLTHIWWANLFGPRFTEGVGREVVSSAPAWRNENLGDGGVLYVLAASPYLYRGSRQYWEAARKHFGRHMPGPISWPDVSWRDLMTSFCSRADHDRNSATFRDPNG